MLSCAESRGSALFPVTDEGRYVADGRRVSRSGCLCDVGGIVDDVDALDMSAGAEIDLENLVVSDDETLRRTGIWLRGRLFVGRDRRGAVEGDSCPRFSGSYTRSKWGAEYDFDNAERVRVGTGVAVQSSISTSKLPGVA